MTEIPDAEELKLVAGKSFVLETVSPVARVAAGSDKVARVRALSPRNILINALSPGLTNLILWYRDGNIQVYNLVVNMDLSQIQRTVKNIFPDVDIKLEAIPGSNIQSGGFLLVRGSIPDAETLDRLMDLLKGFVDESRIRNFTRLNGPQQVQIDVRIAEVSRSNVKSMGFRWLYQKSYKRGDLFISKGSLATNSRDDSESDTSEVIRNFGDAITQDVAGKGIGVILSCLDGDLLSILDILETQNLAKILARPTLTAISGKKAEFMVGGEFPVPVLDDGDVSIDYKEYGVRLAFLPIVIRKELISMYIETSVSDIDYTTTVGAAGTTVPGVGTREAKTSIELRDGQSFAIAGLLKENIASSIDKIPVLGDIPILGALFRSKEFQKSESELVIVVTPHLVKPMNPDQVPPLPGEDMIVNQNIFDFIFMNRAGKPKPDKNMHFHGVAGFE